MYFLLPRRKETLHFYSVWNERHHLYPIVVDFPHSGIIVPDPIRAQMRPDAVLSNTDWFLPNLYAFLEPMGVTSLINHLNRYVIDMNRAPCADAVGGYQKEMVYQHNTFGHPIYRFPLKAKDLHYRRKAFYDVYHRKLKALLEEKIRCFGHCYLIDLHSFAVAKDVTEDLIVSNCCGQASSKEFFDLSCTAFQKQSFSVAKNRTFTGGHMTKYYGAKQRIEAVQVELRYHAYLQNRFFGEEEITSFDESLFCQAQKKLQSAFYQLVRTLE